MGYFDGLTDAAFKKDATGRTLFYPWGIMGSGFIIESDEQREKIRSFYKKMYMILLPAIIIIQTTVGFWLNLALLPVYCVWYYFFAKKLTKSMSRTGERLTLKESTQNSAKSHNLLTLILLTLVSVGFVAIGIWLIIAGQNGFVAYSSVGFFGLCAIIIGKMLVAKLREK